VAFRSNPRKFDSESDLYASALRALMRRAHSIHEMKEYLGRRVEEGADEELVARVIARLREQTYLDDGRFAANYARSHAQSRRQGRFRIARELRARGVPDQHIETALDSVFAETDEAALARVRIKRALARIRGPLDQRKTASIYRSLLAAGFSADVIRTELRAASRDRANDQAPGSADATDADIAETSE
jgi:regulatory protein